MRKWKFWRILRILNLPLPPTSTIGESSQGPALTTSIWLAVRHSSSFFRQSLLYVFELEPQNGLNSLLHFKSQGSAKKKIWIFIRLPKIIKNLTFIKLRFITWVILDDNQRIAFLTICFVEFTQICISYCRVAAYGFIVSRAKSFTFIYQRRNDWAVNTLIAIQTILPFSLGEACSSSQGPRLATATLALFKQFSTLSSQAVLYVFPFSPQTGLYSLVHLSSHP